MGTQRMLLSGVANIRIHSTENAATPSFVMGFAGSLGAFVFWNLRFLFSLLWSLSMIIHLSLLAFGNAGLHRIGIAMISLASFMFFLGACAMIKRMP